MLRRIHVNKFDHGWDKQRELTHAKQIDMGIVPKGTKLTPRPKEIPAWHDLPVDAKKVYARLMENFAAYMAYYAMLGSRAIWADGWKAVAWHTKDTPWEEDKWELYHTEVDFTEVNDLAAQIPIKLKELIALWQTEAEKYNVLPLDDRRYERSADPTRPVAALA